MGWWIKMKHLFIDDVMVEKREMCTFEVNQPEKLGPITDLNKTYIYDRGAYGTIIDNGNIAQMWGGGSVIGKKVSVVQYSQSFDGLNWYSPDMAYPGMGKYKINNVVLDITAEGSVFMDPKDRAFPYKYIYHENDVGLQLIKSPNGINWLLPPIVLDSGHRDTQNTMFWDYRINKYVAYLRGWILPRSVQDREETRLRSIERIEFSTFDQLAPTKKQRGRALGESKIVMSPDDYDMPDTDLYNAAVVQYDESVYVAFPSLYRHIQIGKGYDFRELPNEGLMEVQLAVSRDGINWDRIRKPYFSLGAYRDGDNCVVYMHCGMVRRRNFIYQYYIGSDFTHKINDIFSVRGRRYYLLYALRQRIDGFVSIDNYDMRPGTILTKEVEWQGYLFLNYDAGASGYIKAKIRLPSGELKATQKVLLIGNWPAKQIEFDNDLLDCIGRKVKIELEFRNCKVYGFEV